ncbi:hypothetical protein BVI1335_190037 [Burkholderia vietnamiensis]|nr:hypothetical protein BVI1335_190037 [Burkholderia vietnamiensis]
MSSFAMVDRRALRDVSQVLRRFGSKRRSTDADATRCCPARDRPFGLPAGHDPDSNQAGDCTSFDKDR